MPSDAETSAAMSHADAIADRRGFRNPFVYRHALFPWRHTKICLPRDLCIAEIERDFHQRKWVALLGPNGSGRTTLLRLLARRLAARRAMVPVLVNMEAVSSANRRNVFRAFVNEAVVGLERIPDPDSAGSHNQPLVEYLRAQERQADASTFRNVVYETGIRCPNRSLVLMLDNADRVSDDILGPVFGALVGIFNEQYANRATSAPEGEVSIHLIVTGDEGHWLGNIYTSVTSPLRPCVKKVLLSDFEFAETDVWALADVAQSQTGVPIHASAVKAIDELSGGLPARVQRLLSDAIDHAHDHACERVTDTEVRLLARLAGQEGDAVRRRLRRLQEPLKTIGTTDLTNARLSLAALAGDLRVLWVDAERLTPARQELLALLDIAVRQGIDEGMLSPEQVELLQALAHDVGLPFGSLGRDKVLQLRRRALEAGLDIAAALSDGLVRLIRARALEARLDIATALNQEVVRLFRAEDILRRTLVRNPDARLSMCERNEGVVVHVEGDQVEVEYERGEESFTQVYDKSQFLGGKLPEEGHHFEAWVFAWAWPHVARGIDHLLTPGEIDAISEASEKRSSRPREI